MSGIKSINCHRIELNSIFSMTAPVINHHLKSCRHACKIRLQGISRKFPPNLADNGLHFFNRPNTWKALCDPSFHDRPDVLNGVEIGVAGWPLQDLKFLLTKPLHYLMCSVDFRPILLDIEFNSILRQFIDLIPLIT